MNLQEGDIIELKEGHPVYADVPKHFEFLNEKGNFSMTHAKITIGGDLDYFAGRYVVTKTAFDGGGTVIFGPGDVYQDGHHVFCTSLDGKERRVDFYQSGAFTAVIKDITPVGKAKLTWTE